MPPSLSLSQLVAVAVTTFICTLGGLYLQRHFSHTSKATQKTKCNKDSDHIITETKTKRKIKATRFWDKHHCDELGTTEWLSIITIIVISK